MYEIIPDRGSMRGSPDNLQARWKGNIRSDQNVPTVIANYPDDHAIPGEDKDCNYMASTTHLARASGYDNGLLLSALRQPFDPPEWHCPKDMCCTTTVTIWQ